ncbi:MAG TPA: HEAT repeat domain-containing protein, partial [Bryobacteraceae bacterium]|nr:HEAT repeat domain-containing protein [Bryobacteraceae bacterium]
FLLSRQQPFGGWMDPLQSFENFRTPFRETQMAILALSSYFPKTGRSKGWNVPSVSAGLSSDPAQLLEQLDAVWDLPSAAVLSQIEKATQSNDALIRQAAAEALGRLGRAPNIDLLGDPSKLVQRTAAWATRQAYVRHPDRPVSALGASLTHRSDRVRWGATRIFSQHFAELARRDDLVEPLLKLADQEPSPLIRTDAVRALWQYWFWNPQTSTKSRIEDVLLASMQKPQHPWVARNLRHAIYNLADENIRYLYNNWVPLLAQQEDRDRAIKGRLAVEDRLAGKFANLLETGSAAGRKELLTALAELPLRRGDIYDLEADLSKQAPPVYNRIGNDIEQIAFFGEAAERMARAIEPLLASPDSEMRQAAARAVLLVRDTRFADVNRLAGAPGAKTKSVMAKIESMPEAVDVARSLKPAPVTVAVKGSSGAPVRKVKLDEAFFRGYVQPILEKRGRDGYACVHCHASHTLFNGTYGTALNVVNADDPEQSLLLLKPTSTAESEGVAGAAAVAHGGGVRWPKGSPEYVTILDWIRGAKE